MVCLEKKLNFATIYRCLVSASQTVVRVALCIQIPINFCWFWRIIFRSSYFIALFLDTSFRVNIDNILNARQSCWNCFHWNLILSKSFPLISNRIHINIIRLNRKYFNNYLTQCLIIHWIKIYYLQLNSTLTRCAPRDRISTVYDSNKTKSKSKRCTGPRTHYIQYMVIKGTLQGAMKHISMHT